MKTPDADNNAHRWLDGEMNERECANFEAEMQKHPELRTDVNALKQLGTLLRSHVTMERPVPNADFFNSQIQERIAQIQHEESRILATAHISWFNWLRAPWAVTAGAAAVLAVSLLVLNRNDAALRTQILSHYTPNPNVEVTSFNSPDAGATVLLLDGLDALPEDWEVSGLSVPSGERNVEIAAADSMMIYPANRHVSFS